MRTDSTESEALSILRLVPDEPERALRLLELAQARAAAGSHERERFRLRLVVLNHQARQGNIAELRPQLIEAIALARLRGWTVEWLLAKLLELFLCTLTTRHREGLQQAEAIAEAAEAHLDEIELAWFDLMVGHFRGYLVGWAEEQQRAYQALRRLSRNPDAPPGLVANTKKNVGYSHLLVRNLDLARVYLHDAYRLYLPLPATPRKLSAAKAWAQYLLVVGDAQQAGQVIRAAVGQDRRPQVPTYLAGAQLVAAEVAIVQGQSAAALELLEQAREASDASHEPAIAVHQAYVHALLLEAQAMPEAAALVAREGCQRIADHDHEVAVQSCLGLSARLHAQIGDYRSAYLDQCKLLELREGLARKAADIRHIELHVDHETHIARIRLDFAEREKALAEAAEADIQQKNRLLEARLRDVERLQESLRELATKDPLTGLPNRRFLADALPGLLDDASRRNVRVTVVIIDIDHFKAVNDQHGHQMGDVVLQGFSELLLRNFRSDDLCCRHGGEEFCVVMTGIDDEAARHRVEGLTTILADASFALGDRRVGGQSFSAGMVSFTANPGRDLDSVFRQADQALYQAKEQGRRRIVAVSHA